MIEVDLHTHSLFSSCGLHTVLELLEGAKQRGMKAIAITDHGPALGGRVSNVFFDRLHQPCQGIRLLKGMECNFLKEKGRIDCPKQYLPMMDVVLAGIHLGEHSRLSREELTEVVLHAMASNPYIDIITHPNSTMFPLCYDELARVAAKDGIALELNNSKSALRQVSDEETWQLVMACLKAGCRMAVASDTHAIHEMGQDSAVRPFLQRAGFPEELVINRNAESAFAFLEERKHLKNL